MNKVLKLPVADHTLGDVHCCPHCGYPSASQRGVAVHASMSHGRNGHADRNWSIFYAYRREGQSAAVLSGVWALSMGSVYRIIQRGVAYPGIYDLIDG